MTVYLDISLVSAILSTTIEEIYDKYIQNLFLFQCPHLVPPVIQKGLSDVTICEGEDVQFEARCFSKPIADFMWLKDNSSVSLSNRIAISQMDPTHSILKITKADRNDCGQYKLLASNVVGEAYTAASLNAKGIKLL